MMSETRFRADRVVVRQSIAGWMFGSMMLVFLVGCGPADADPKASLFEHDHAVADHWPADLRDVAVKIRKRLSLPKMDAQTRLEITDLVSWTAEVAADTNLAEADWLPIYHASESLMASLRVNGETLTDQHRAELESLCELVDQASEKIPDQLSHLVKAD